MAIGGDDDQPEWAPSTYALHVTRWEDPQDESPTTIVLSHPTAPFLRRLDTEDEEALRACALEYLNAANEQAELELPPRWLEDLGLDEPPDAKVFGWAPIEDEDQSLPFASFWFTREDENQKLIDRTLVLMMTEQLGGELQGSEFGIRVVGHARSVGDQEDELRLTGLSAVLPFGPYLSRTFDGGSGGF